MAQDFMEKKIRRLLFKGNNWLGDVIMSLPAIYFAKKVFTRVHIAVLTDPNYAELYQSQSYIDEVVTYRLERGIKRLKSMSRIAKKLKGFDCAIIFPRSFSSAFMVYLAGIPRRIGYKGDMRAALLTDAVEREEVVKNIHRVYYFLNLLTPIYKGKIKPRMPELGIPLHLKKWAQQQIRKDKIVVGFNPGAIYGSAKMWDIEKFAKVARLLIKSHNVKIVVFGSQSEIELSEKFCHLVNGKDSLINFTGKTSVLQLCALIDRCSLFITNDTGAMHVADALGVPIVAIFGSTDPYTTSPYGVKKTIIRHKVECAPCLLKKCPKDHKCMRLVRVDEVYDAAVKWLEKTKR
jgi:heptosyltransferase-2